ncbi:unannotated protein [freshwater metagenome]|uniref:Unannotated protein n=1 Tax=freshwater metagenome TaxID=449393 RepID=A0A6J7CNC0_9ZZZZ|nr:bifunctional oligoribonuclease/PAP phosphatase NrnA [Actinomycetota bacterium]
MSITWQQRATQADWAQALELIGSADQPLLLAHVSPDGDALGSAMAVGLALKSLGKNPIVSFGDDPFVVPRILQFLPGQELLVAPADVPQHTPVVVTFDASTVQRLGIFQERAERADVLVAVDHHASYSGFGTHHLVEVGNPATALLALQLIDQLGVRLDQAMATCIYAGLITDTGSFRYAATTPYVHEVAARLMATGIEHDQIARQLYDTAPFGYVQVLGAALNRAVLEADSAGGLGLVWTTVSVADRSAANLGIDSVEAVIDAVRVAQEADVAVVLKEHEDRTWRVSMRSRGGVDVAQVCIALGGGGHRLAAGYTSALDPQQTMQHIRAGLAAATAIPS